MNAVNKEVRPAKYTKDVEADVVFVQDLLSEESEYSGLSAAL